MSLREVLVVLLVVAVGLSGTAWFLATHERVTETEWTGFTGEAKRNPWLAAQRLLSRMEIPAEEVRTLPGLRSLPPRATLIVPRAHQTVSASLREALVAWVHNGGHLIVEAEPLVQDDSLLDAFDVQRSAITPDQTQRRIGDRNKPPPYEIKLPNAVAPAALDMRPSVSLQSADTWFRAGDASGTSLVAKKIGSGMVTAISDLRYLTNNAIGTRDHAQFLWDLVRLDQAGAAHSQPVDKGQQTVLFFNRPGKLSLPDWLRTHAWAPLTGGAIALVLWLWRSIPRFGPIAPDAGRGRRSLLDHLRASGRFLWSTGHATRLLESSRTACLRELSRSLPYFQNATPQARLSQLQQVLGVQEEQARYLLEPQQGASMTQFLHTVRAYQHIYSRLAARKTEIAARAG